MVLVRFRAGIPEQQKDLIVASHGARRKKILRGESGIEKLELSAGQDVQGAALQAMLDPAIEFAEPNFLISHDQLGPTPNDPRFNEQWSLRNTGQSGGQFGSDIGVAGAWQTTTGTQATVIAVIDSGIDFTHPDLLNNQWNNLNPVNGDPHGWDFVTDSGVIRDEQGHGTAVAGIIAAQGNNATGMTGVMWLASLMSLRVLDNTGTGDIANAVEAIDYAAMHRAQVINLSWGTSGMSLSLKDAIERAIRRGVVVVCSAGNSSQDVDSVPYYPASFGSRDLIAVAASDNFDQLTSWSNWGRTKVSIAAPGANILTTQMSGGYGSVSGTSAAAPLVSGVAGLLKGAKPWLNPHGVLKAITDGARKVVSLSGKVSSGGVLDAAQAFDSARPYGNGGGNGGSGANPRGGSAHGPGGGFNTPPPVTTGGPLPNLPNLDQLRNAPTFQPKAKAPIQSNMICADCDPLSGGGGGGYYPGQRSKLLNSSNATAERNRAAGGGPGFPQLQLECSASEFAGAFRFGCESHALLQLSRVDERWFIHQIQCRFRFARAGFQTGVADAATEIHRCANRRDCLHHGAALWRARRDAASGNDERL